MKASLSTVTSQSENIVTLRLDCHLNFKPGQAVQVHFPKEHKKHFYSISSSPTEGPFFEITVKSEAGSLLAKTIAGMKPGDELFVDGPLGGMLSLPEPVLIPLAFIAAGTGVTPFRSLIRFLIDKAIPVDYWLLHSVRDRAGLLFHADFMSWSARHGNFRYIPTITRDHGANWKHETGRITDALLRKHVTAKDTLYFLCGPTAFVADMGQILQGTLKVPMEKIRSEKW